MPNTADDAATKAAADQVELDKSKTVETADKEKVVAPEDKLKGIKKANKTLQAERDAARGELDKLKAEAAKAKMSAEERASADLAALNKQLADAKLEIEKERKAADRERKISKLVAQHDLADPEFGDLVLNKFDPDEHDDFDTFVKDLKKQPKYGALFRGERQRITNEDGSDIVPNVPGGAGGTGKGRDSAGASDQDAELARAQFPNDEKKQKKFLDNLAATKRGGK